MAVEKILLEVNVSTEQSVKNAADLKRSIAETQKEIAALTAATKGNEGATKAAAGTFAKLEAQLKSQKKEYSDNVREIQNLDRINKSTAEGSIEQMRAALSVLTKQYNGLSQAERENTKDGYALQKQIKGLSDKLKEQEAAVGDTRRNVGNYAEAFSKLPGPLGKAGNAASAFNTTLKANPILLVVSLLVQFAQQLGKNATVADQVTAVFEGLNKAFQFIIDTVVDTVTNFDKLTEAITHPIDFLKKLGGGLIDAGKSGYEGSRQLDAFTLSSGKLNNEIQKNEKSIEALENKLLNISLSFEERKKIAEDLANLEIENAKKRAAIADEELKVNQKILEGKTLSNEEEQKLADLAATAEAARLDEETANQQKATRIAKLLRKEDLADAAAQRAAAQQTEEEKLKAHREKLEQIGDAFAEKEAANFQKLQDDKTKAQEEAEAKRLQDFAETFNRETALIEQQLEVSELNADNEIKNAEELNKKKLELKLAALQQELELTKQYLGASGVITQEQALGIAKIEALIESVQQKLKPKEDAPNFGESIGLSTDNVDEIQQNIQLIQQGLNVLQDAINADAQIRLNQIDTQANAEISAINASTDSEKEKAAKIKAVQKKAAQERYEIEKKQFETNKTFQIINTLIATASAIVAQLANPTPYVGFVLSALAAVAGAAQIAVISSQQPPPAPSFQEGGFTERGNPNEVATNLGAKDYTYHKSEYVAPAHILATPEGQYHVSQLEKMRLAKRSGRKYLGGMADGGFAVRGATSGNASAQQIVDGILAGVQNLPAPIVRVTEINRVNKQVNDVKVSSELR